MHTSPQPTQVMPPRPRLELNLADYNAKGGSIRCSGEGIEFACTLWPLSDATVAALEVVAHSQGRICLDCCGEPLLFDLVAFECKELRKVRIVGRIVGSAPTAAG
jgi:hypothetical protein